MNIKGLPASVSRLVSTSSERRLMLSGALVVAVAAIITYYSALANGFFSDEFIRLDIAARVHGLDYWIKYLDPRMQDLWYRPMVGIQWKIEYILFGTSFPLYHQVQILYHALNCVLLYLLVIRIARSWRPALIAALLYAVLPLTSMAVYWTAVHDPLAGVFSLLALLAWNDYVESGSRTKLVLTYGMLIGALMSKEISLGLPVLFLLVEYLETRQRLSIGHIIQRYSGFGVMMLAYAVIYVIVSTRSVFTQQIGVKIGWHIVPVFLYYISQMALPWQAADLIRTVWLLGVAVIILYAILRVDRRWLLVVAAGTIPVLAVAPIPPYLSNTRYVYLPLMAWVVALAFLLEGAVRLLSLRRWSLARIGIAFGLTWLMWQGSLATNELIVNYGGFTREVRLQFQPIFKQMPNVPPGTFFYFFDTPMQAQDISGLFFLHYGANVQVSGTDRPEIVSLRDHPAAFVSYLREANKFGAYQVDPDAAAQVQPALPVQFGNSISLISAQPASTRIKRGEAAALLVYWRALAQVDRNYTVFMHLVNSNGETIAGHDSQPHHGNSPTSTWRPNQVIADGLLLPLGADIPAGEYQIEIGWYDASSGKRLPAIDDAGNMIGDKVVIQTFIVN